MHEHGIKQAPSIVPSNPKPKRCPAAMREVSHYDPPFVHCSDHSRWPAIAAPTPLLRYHRTSPLRHLLPETLREARETPRTERKPLCVIVQVTSHRKCVVIPYAIHSSSLCRCFMWVRRRKRQCRRRWSWGPLCAFSDDSCRLDGDCIVV